MVLDIEIPPAKPLFSDTRPRDLILEEELGWAESTIDLVYLFLHSLSKLERL